MAQTPSHVSHKHLIADKASIALWTSCHCSYTCKWRLAHMVSQESVLGGSISMERALDSSVGQMLGLRPRPPATKRHIDKHMANKHDCRMKHEELRKPINEFCNAFFDVNELNAPLAPGRPTLTIPHRFVFSNHLPPPIFMTFVVFRLTSPYADLWVLGHSNLALDRTSSLLLPPQQSGRPPICLKQFTVHAVDMPQPIQLRCRFCSWS